MKIELGERTEQHVRIYFKRTRDPEIQAMLHQSAQTVEQAVSDYRNTLLPGATSYGRTIYADGSYIGDIWCYGINRRETPNAMIGYCLFEKDFWNKGIMTKALALFRTEVLTKLNLTSLGAFAWKSNGASLRVLEKNGFSLREQFQEDNMTAVYYQWEVEG